MFDTLYQQGEFVPAGQPVISLLPPANIRAVFSCREPELAFVAARHTVSITFNGAPHPVAAHVTYVAPQAEYSPPELYNRDNRERLLFMIEATPDETPELIHPGQPLDVRVEKR